MMKGSLPDEPCTMQRTASACSGLLAMLRFFQLLTCRQAGICMQQHQKLRQKHCRVTPIYGWATHDEISWIPVWEVLAYMQRDIDSARLSVTQTRHLGLGVPRSLAEFTSIEPALRNASQESFA